MICPNCQTPNDEQAKFCERCGTALAVTTPPPPKSSPKTLVIVLVCVAVCCAAALAMLLPMLFNRPPMTDDGNGEAASQAASTTQPVLTTAPTTAPTEPPKTEAENTEELYEAVLRAYAEAYPWEMVTELPGIGEVSQLYWHHRDLSEIGYAYLDADHDGQRELLLGTVSGSPPMIYDMFTVVNGKVSHLFSSGERSLYRLREDGKLIHAWSSGAAVSGTDLCYINGKKNGVETECRVAMDAFYAEQNGYISSMGDPQVQNNSWFIAEGGRDESLYRHVAREEALARQEEIAEGTVDVTYHPLTELPFCEEPVFTACSFRGLTIDQAVAVAGSGSQVAEYLYKGGWGKVWYPNNESPYSFFYACDHTNMGKPVIGTELLTAVGIRPNVGTVAVTEGVESSSTLAELQEMFSDGEVYENQVESGMAFSCELEDGINMAFYWYDGNTAKKADWIVVAF